MQNDITTRYSIKVTTYVAGSTAQQPKAFKITKVIQSCLSFAAVNCNNSHLNFA